MEQQRENVLIVDDDREILFLLEKALERRFKVLSASNAHDAIQALENNEVSAIITDYRMPLMNGVELLNRSQEIRAQAARILITSLDRIHLLRDAVNLARVHRFLSKPIRFADIADIVAGAIHEIVLEAENGRLVVELKEKNENLTKLVAELELQQGVLEQKVAERTAQLQTVVEELKTAALRDGLTGLYNHGYFHEALDTEIARSKRHHHHIGLLFLDVDHFKQYNDRMGHPAGDRLLVKLADMISGRGTTADMPRARRSDTSARYGGEEFVIILPETQLGGAVVRAERLRVVIGSMPFEGGSGQPLGCVSVSIGVSCYPDDGVDKKTLVETADKRLYAAKNAGRNRVCFKDGEAEEPNHQTK